ncbi:G protein-coupled receptor 137Ba-like isoform X2 [Mya arenaria]|uniref:G protein-coupled receptor 137Ba-like isoform X2 n=1 Tax=Mya arenaria TaxID=6604 RepID=UPI0022E12E3B|nr:G protein-coupled receptor 137Ba-like isoform X2 [Mya arenaria]
MAISETPSYILEYKNVVSITTPMLSKNSTTTPGAVTFPPLVPALKPSFERGLTYTFVCVYGILFFMVYIQLWMVVHKAKARYEPSRLKLSLKVLLGITVVIFLTTNVSCAVITKMYDDQATSLPYAMLLIRVTINDTLFILVSLCLSVCIYKLAKMAAASVVLEAKGTTVCKALATCGLIMFLYLTRAIYNLIAVFPVNRKTHKLPSFGYGWINVTDQADFVQLDKGYAYASFAVVLFVWEILPMFIVIVFFRVRTQNSAKGLNDLPSHTQNTRAYFFDNPRRYDSDDDISAASDYFHSHQSDSSQGRYSINASQSRASIDASVETLRGSPRTTLPKGPTLGYGAVMTSDRHYSYSVSPQPAGFTDNTRYGST